MSDPCHLPVPTEIRLMKEFRFLPAVGMTYQLLNSLALLTLPLMVSLSNHLILRQYHHERSR